MTAPFDVGSRVVCPDPTGRWFVGTVTHVHTCGDLRVSYGDGSFRATAGEVRPVMPRDRDDLERWGRWWWIDDEVVEVATRAVGPYIWRTGVEDGSAAGADAGWRGPVQPPPVVRG